MKRKTILLLAAAALLLVAAVGGTVAYLATSTGTVKNVFEPTRPGVDIGEDFDNKTVKKDVYLTNTGNIDAYVRMAYIVNWKSTSEEDGKAVMPIAEGQYDVIFVEDWKSKWLQIGNYYYYTDVVPPQMSPEDQNANTSILIKELKLTDGVTPPEGYTLNVEILAQSIQAEPADVVEKVWPVKVVDGELTSVPAAEE